MGDSQTKVKDSSPKAPEPTEGEIAVPGQAFAADVCTWMDPFPGWSRERFTVAIDDGIVMIHEGRGLDLGRVLSYEANTTTVNEGLKGPEDDYDAAVFDGRGLVVAIIRRRHGRPDSIVRIGDDD